MSGLAEVLRWLAAPMSGASLHEIAPWAAWHARCMVLAWGVMMPAGALAARYFKVLPGQGWPARLDDRRWWRAHRLLQWSGVALMTVGIAVVLGRDTLPSSTDAARWHTIAGWGVLALGWGQVVAAMLRGSKGGPSDKGMRGDHYDITPRRVWFERIHKGLGWGALFVAIAVIGMGLVAADAPRWMGIVLLAWWVLLGGLAWRWQRAGRCIDTYQAIWGPDPTHPGNLRQPIGWGVHRPAPPTLTDGKTT